MVNFLCSEFADETDSDYYIAYLLRDNNYFYNTVYQIVKRNTEGYYARVYKVSMNGYIKIVYDTEGLNSLEHFAMSAKAGDMMEVIEKMVNVLIKIRTDSFTQVETIDVRPHKIFIDDKLNIRLVCLPVSIMSSRETYMAFEENVRNLITTILYQSECMNDKFVDKLFHDCMDFTLSLDDLQAAFGGKKYGIRSISEDSDAGQPAGRESIFGYFILVAEDPVKNTDIIVNSTDYIIGKGTQGTNCTIQSSTAVSRIHCEFVISDGNIFVMDLESTNGTYVNGEQVMPNCYTPVKIGDVIEIADCRYKVSKA